MRVATALVSSFVLLISSAGTSGAQSLLPPELAIAGVSQARWDQVSARVGVLERERSRSNEREHVARLEGEQAARRRIAARLLLDRPNAPMAEILGAIDRQNASLERAYDELRRVKADYAGAVLDPAIAEVERTLGRGDVAAALSQLGLLRAQGDPSIAGYARIYVLSGELSSANSDYESAAASFRRAAELFPPDRATERTYYRASAWNAEFNRGSLWDRSRTQALEAELSQISTSLGSAPAADTPGRQLWFLVHMLLGATQDHLGYIGDASASRRAINSFLNAARTPELSGLESASIYYGVGSGTLQLASRVPDVAASDAAVAFRRCLDLAAGVADRQYQAYCRAGVLMSELQAARQPGSAANLRPLIARLAAAEAEVAAYDPAMGSYVADTNFAAQRFLVELGDNSYYAPVVTHYQSRLAATEPQSAEWLDAKVHLASILRLSASAPDIYLARRHAEEALAAMEISADAQPTFREGWAYNEIGHASWAIARRTSQRREFDRAAAEFESARRVYSDLGYPSNAEYMTRYIEQIRQQRRRAR